MLKKIIETVKCLIYNFIDYYEDSGVIVNKVVDFQNKIIVYHQNTIKDELEKFYQKLFNQSLQLDLIAYPMLQKHMKRAIKEMIHKPTLPYETFRAIF